MWPSLVTYFFKFESEGEQIAKQSKAEQSTEENA